MLLHVLFVNIPTFHHTSKRRPRRKDKVRLAARHERGTFGVSGNITREQGKVKGRGTRAPRNVRYGA